MVCFVTFVPGKSRGAVVQWCSGAVVRYDLYGRRILERDFVKEAGLNLVGMNSGIYILVVEQKVTTIEGT